MPLIIEQLELFRDALSVCPHPGKVKFKSKAKARKRARQLSMKYYECVCGKWHLTSTVHHTDCPICGMPDDEWQSCGCHEDILYGRD